MQYEVDWVWTHWASSPHMVVLVVQSYDLCSAVGSMSHACHMCVTASSPAPTEPLAPHPPWEQDSSSEPSPQSSKKLQRRLALMHFLFPHRNSFLSWLQLLGLAVGDSAGEGQQL